jgi:hypothetical protein
VAIENCQRPLGAVRSGCVHSIGQAEKFNRPQNFRAVARTPEWAENAREPLESAQGMKREGMMEAYILYLHFDVIAFDHDFVTWNALLRWRPQNSAGFQEE